MSDVWACENCEAEWTSKWAALECCSPTVEYGRD